VNPSVALDVLLVAVDTEVAEQFPLVVVFTLSALFATVGVINYYVLLDFQYFTHYFLP